MSPDQLDKGNVPSIEHSIADDEIYNQFVEIVCKLPFELQQRIFISLYSQFYQSELIPVISKSSMICSVLSPLFSQLLLTKGKLHFQRISEYNYLKIGTASYNALVELVKDGSLPLRFLKIVDFDGFDDDDEILMLLEKASSIGINSQQQMKKVYGLDKKLLSKVTDLSLDDLSFITEEILDLLGPSLTDFAAPLKFHQDDQLEKLFSLIKAIDHSHKLTLHLPLTSKNLMSVVMDDYVDGDTNALYSLSSLDNEYKELIELIDSSYSGVQLRYIMFELVNEHTRLPSIDEFVKQVGYLHFSDFCLIAFPKFTYINASIGCLSRMANLRTVVLTGGFKITFENVGSLKHLEKVKDLMLEGGDVSMKWLSEGLPCNLKELTIAHDALFNFGDIFHVPASLKSITILNDKDIPRMSLNFFDFDKSNLEVLKFRQKSAVIKLFIVDFEKLPESLKEINFYELTDFIVQRDDPIKSKGFYKAEKFFKLCSITENDYHIYKNLKTNTKCQFYDDLEWFHTSFGYGSKFMDDEFGSDSERINDETDDPNTRRIRYILGKEYLEELLHGHGELTLEPLHITESEESEDEPSSYGDSS